MKKFITFVLFLIILTLGCSSPPPPSPLPSPPPKQWVEIKTWSDNGYKTLESFEAKTGELRIKWKTTNPAEGLAIILLNKENTFKDKPVSYTGGTGSGEDMTLTRIEPGIYYTDVFSMGNWVISIEELR